MTTSLNDLTFLEIEQYRQKCAIGEATVEDAKRIVAYLREKRGKARLETAPTKKSAAKAEPMISNDDLLEGL